MNARCCAYSFLQEDGSSCDYEIMTDWLASETAAVIHDSSFSSELLHCVELIYHCNGSIRGRLAIEEEDLKWLNELYENLSQQVQIKSFVVPQGCKAAIGLHRLRVMAKACVRLAYKCEKEGKRVDRRLLDFLNILSNVFFYMALIENQRAQVEEIPFVSKSYDC